MPCVSLCSKRTNSTPSAVICSSSAARSNVLRAAVLRVGIVFLLKSHYLFQKVSVGRAGGGLWQALAQLSCIRRVETTSSPKNFDLQVTFGLDVAPSTTGA